ncbi:phage tail assembly protein T [Streptomyces sp. IBSNAI002]|uniref:phage tail assembly protein T n=1 Tax=Streptomyces sp. IBSNAI002 TaxID=3457500 RepID=UPI003FD34CCB
MTVGRLLSEAGSAELAEWKAYEKLTGPLGGLRGDLHAALVSAAVINSQRAKGKRPVNPIAFLPRWDTERVRKTPEELFRAAMAANVALGGSLRRTTPDTDA